MATPENRYRRLFESARDGILLIDFANGRVVDANPQAATLLGTGRTQLIGQELSATRLFHDPSDLATIQAELRTQGHSRGEIGGVRVSQRGGLLTIEQTSSLYDEDGRQTMQLTLRDVTAKKRVEKRLRESEARFRATYDDIGVGIAHVDLDGRWLSVNKKLCEITGYERHVLLRMSFQEITHPDDLDEDVDSMQRTLNGEMESYTMEKRYIRPDGTTVWVCLTGSVLRDDLGHVLNFVAVVEDISARKQAEAALREREARFKIMADAAPVLIWLSGLDGLCTYFNHAWLSFTGRTNEQELGNGWAESIHPEDIDHCLGVYTEAFHARCSFEMECRLRHHTGEYRWVLDRGIPIVKEDGGFDGYIGACIDIHDQKTVADELRRARNHAEAANRAKDEFLAALSHELRTPLSPVLLLAAAMEQDTTLSESLRTDFASIRKNIELEARLIDDLLDVSRITQGKLLLRQETIDPHRLIDHVVEMLRGDMTAKNIVPTFDLAARPCAVHADPVRLEQVIWNVLRNAVKFTPTTGKIHLQTRKAGEAFHLLVTDSGMGITKAEMPRIFNAFSQGDEAMEARFGGVGLGLSICSHLVQEHQGRIWAESAGRGHGATFHVELPLAHETAPNIPAALPDVELAQPLHILLVEDNEATRSALTRFLTKRGHIVTTAECVTEAKKLASGQTFDVLVSDIGLPDGTGHELMRHLKKEHQLTGIALSGYGMAADIEESLQAGFTHHLCKPVRIKQVEQAIASAMLAKAGGGDQVVLAASPELARGKAPLGKA